MLESPDGREMVINEMHPGDIFGELGLLTRQPRSTSAIARADGELLALPRQAFLDILEAEPALAHDSSTNNLIRRYRKLKAGA